MSENPKKPTTGRTWADLLSAFPIWLFGIAASVFVLLMGYATLIAENPVQLGVLGTWGPDRQTKTDGVPSGAVMAFDFDLKTSPGCPAGWDFFEPGGGRFIIGAGDHNNKWFPADSTEARRLSIYKTYAQDERAGMQETREAEATGGEEVVALTFKQMPSHDHGGVTGNDPARQLVNKEGSYSSGQRGDAAETGRSINVGFIKNHHHAISTAGGRPDGTTEPHDNMPPYIALYYCKKS